MPDDKTKKTNPTKSAEAEHPSSSSSVSYPGFIPAHGGYEKLLAYLLDQQLRKLEQAFLQEGGLRERMTRARLAVRAGKTI